ncbi:hypothetical protein N7456_002615 [Penicillium angulare]|uniref:Uncharacterized protein n=1 Tax=Penicillium angulare TaxID=116970 RepID=A0A9W9G8M9_9EURO|nr:hypothetical protein N7456_002615 [Penicillium angulare]
MSNRCQLPGDEILAMIHNPDHPNWGDDDMRLALEEDFKEWRSTEEFLKTMFPMKFELEYIQARAVHRDDASMKPYILLQLTPREYLSRHLHEFLISLKKDEFFDSLNILSEVNISLMDIIQHNRFTGAPW